MYSYSYRQRRRVTFKDVLMRSYNDIMKSVISTTNPFLYVLILCMLSSVSCEPLQRMTLAAVGTIAEIRFPAFLAFPVARGFGVCFRCSTSRRMDCSQCRLLCLSAVQLRKKVQRRRRTCALTLTSARLLPARFPLLASRRRRIIDIGRFAFFRVL